jgi:amino acid adenylation domain-containing protein
VAPDQAGEQARAIMQQRFDLAEDRLLRVALLRLAADQHVLVLAMHHVVSDGWSIGVLVREVEALYAAFAQGLPSPLPELPVQYADYAVWQRRWLIDGALERQLAYWTHQLAGAPAALELPTDRPRPAVPSFRGAVHHFTIDAARTAALIELARRDGATLFMLLLAAFQVLLARCSGQHDVVVGTPIAGRTRAETEGLIGFFVNMLALRSRLDGAASFRSVLHGVKAAALDAYAHQDLPFEKLVEALHPIRDLSREPIVQAVFALQNMPQQPTRMAGLAIEPFDTGPVPAKFDLELSMVEADGALAASIVYATDLFDAATIERLAGHLARLLDAIVADPERRTSELPLLGEAERRQLAAWAGTVVPYPEDRCLQDLFAAQAARTPDAPAVICEDHTLSYRELERRANRLAHHLRAIGVGPDVVVGLSMTRSPDLVVGVLGILKAGGAYLPLDPGYPADRLAFMLADARVPVLLTQSHLVDRLPVHAATLVRLDADAPHIARWPDTPPPGATDPQHLAYVIYTSGSTGRPKGVMIPHRGAMNLAEAQLTGLPLGPADRILQFASISFDAAVWDLLMAWRAGAALVLADPHDLMPGEPLRELIIRQHITTVLLPPSALAALPSAELPCLTTLLVGGEACAAEQLRPWLAGRIVLNAYGPTEASVCTTLFDCGSDQRRPPIGRPLPNTRTYVLDQRLEPVPIGVAGELFIGGAGLARGYLARPALTAERFVPNPFAPGERLYRTGDRVRWRADGELEFLGRLDTQVKIRGFRIEPGEIEAALLAQPGIEHAIVIARDDAVGKRLVAYLVGHADAVADTGELRRKLQQSLPDYMVPAAFVTLDRLPLTPNGKLDRTALPAPEWNAGADYVAPRNPLETVLAGLFAELLGINRVGVNDNFFEAGGHSLLAMRLVSHVRAALGASLPVRAIFMSPTVAELAPHIEQALTNQIEAMTAEEIEAALADAAASIPSQ